VYGARLLLKNCRDTLFGGGVGYLAAQMLNILAKTPEGVAAVQGRQH